MAEFYKTNLFFQAVAEARELKRKNKSNAEIIKALKKYKTVDPEKAMSYKGKLFKENLMKNKLAEGSATKNIKEFKKALFGEDFLIPDNKSAIKAGKEIKPPIKGTPHFKTNTPKDGVPARDWSHQYEVTYSKTGSLMEKNNTHEISPALREAIDIARTREHLMETLDSDAMKLLNKLNESDEEGQEGLYDMADKHSEEKESDFSYLNEHFERIYRKALRENSWAANEGVDLYENEFLTRIEDDGMTPKEAAIEVGKLVGRPDIKQLMLDMWEESSRWS
jgi:hypothetical protein